MTDESKLQFAHSAMRSVIYWPRGAKKALMVSADLIALPLILWLAITLRLGSFEHGDSGGGLLFVALPLITVPILVKLGLYRAVIRFISSKALVAALLGVTVSTMILALLTYAPGFGSVPASTFVGVQRWKPVAMI